MKKEYSKEEVVELIDELNERASIGRKLTSIDDITQEFKREKGLIEEKEEFKVGWYKSNSNHYLAYHGKDFRYGFNFMRGWFREEKYDPTVWHAPDELATKEEVETALIKEAKKRGFKVGVEFLSATGGGGKFKVGQKLYLSSYVLYSKKECGCIFLDGIWAKKIKVREVTLSEIEDKFGYKVKIVKK